ncbi:MAG: endonuclease/exonuclease/phosphatase family protein [Deltaproteobacteria bacterium]|nr:endonuclease/exonuclease/phosphatase family protein [Deltaproteobacteria bacterium]
MPLLPLVAVLLAAGCGLPPPDPEAPSFVLLTWNLHFEVSGHPDAARVIRASGADLVLVQECNEEWQARLDEDLGDLYPHREWVLSGLNGGIGVLSRTPVSEVEPLPSPLDWFPAVRVSIDTAIGPLQILGVHLHPPVSEAGSLLAGAFTTADDRLREICDYRSALRADTPAVIAGDFNAGPWEPAVRALAVEGWRDAVSRAHPFGMTWRGRIRDILPAAAQIDHVLVPADLCAVDVRILHDGPSDHWPVRVAIQPCR